MLDSGQPAPGEQKTLETTKPAERFFNSWNQAKTTEKKLTALKESQDKNELDQLSDSEKETLIKQIAAIIEQEKDFGLAGNFFDVLVPSGRTDFSQKTFADYFASVLADLPALGYKKAGETFLNILSQAASDLDPLISPIEILKIFGKLKTRRRETFFFDQTLSWLLSNKKYSETIEREILETIEKDETLGLVCLNAVETAMYSAEDLESFRPISNIVELVKKIADNPKHSLLTRRVCEAIYQKATLNQEIPHLTDWEVAELFDRDPTKEEIDEERAYKEKAKLGLNISFELDEEHVGDFSKNYYGIFSDADNKLSSLLPKGQKRYAPKDRVNIGQILSRQNPSSFHEAERQDTAGIVFSIFSREETAAALSADFGFELNGLTLREQLWFVNSLRNYKPEQEKTVSSFTQKFGLNGARAFLSCEYGDRFRETVLTIGEKLPEELANQVFEQYGRLALLAQEKAGELIKEFTTDGQELKIDAAVVEQELLRRAKDFLVEISTMTKTSPEAIQERLTRYKTDMVVFAGLFRAAFKQTGRIELGTIKGLKLESFTPEQISDTDKEEMLKIFSENWKKLKPEVEPDLTLELKERLSKKDPWCVFNIFRKDGAIVAFNRFEAFGETDGRPALYGKSLNILRDLQGSYLGDAFRTNVIDTAAKDHIIVIDVYADLSTGPFQVQQLGYAITGVQKFLRGKNGEIDTRLIMTRDDRKKYSKKDLIIEKFDLSNGQKEMLQKIQELTDQGLVGTSYEIDPSDPNVRYIGFEKDVIPAAESEVQELMAA